MTTAVSVVDTKWFTGRDCIGIVLVDTGHGYKAYIGLASGYNEESDAESIAAGGTRFHYGSALWPHITEWAS
jgi:hypothetical protein